MGARWQFDSQDLYCGEVARKGITVSLTSGTLDINSAYVMVYNAEDQSNISSGAATIDGGNVYSYITAGTNKGPQYADFLFVHGSATRIARLNYEVI